MANAQFKAEYYAGKDVASAVYLVDVNGNIISSSADINGNTKVVGNIASGVTDVGNPVLVGGMASGTAPTTVASGQRVKAWFGTAGQTVIALADINGATASMNAPGDTQGTQTGLSTTSQEMLWNGVNWDRFRGNFDTSALITASSVTTTQTSADQINYNGNGIKVILNVTVPGTGSVTLSIQGKDAASGTYYAMLTGLAVTTVSTNVYTIFPGITATANAAVSDVLPRTWRITVTANNANPTTYTVGASVIV